MNDIFVEIQKLETANSMWQLIAGVSLAFLALLRWIIGIHNSNIEKMLDKRLVEFKKELMDKFVERDLCFAEHKLAESNVMALREKIESMDDKQDMILSVLMKE